jgi:hypothetical protein
VINVKNSEVKMVEGGFLSSISINKKRVVVVVVAGKNGD